MSGFVHSNGAWLPYTPAISSQGGGSPSLTSVAGFYQQIGKNVRYRLTFQINATNGASIALTASLPVNAKTDAVQTAAGRCNTDGTPMIGYILTPNSIYLQTMAAAFKGGPGDSFSISGEYEAA